jgi:hypothetical protein
MASQGNIEIRNAVNPITIWQKGAAVRKWKPAMDDVLEERVEYVTFCVEVGPSDSA